MIIGTSDPMVIGSIFDSELLRKSADFDEFYEPGTRIMIIREVTKTEMSDYMRNVENREPALSGYERYFYEVSTD